MSAAPVYRVVMGISDSMLSSSVSRVVSQHPRFQIAATAPNSVMTLSAAEAAQPEVIIVSELSPGTPASALLDDMAAIASRPLLILTVPYERPEETRPDFVVGDHDLDALVSALDSTASLLDNPGQPIERRQRADRRVAQDWSKVFAERRVSVRRADDHDQAADADASAAIQSR